ncbi:MAG: hypothetical protein JW871_04035 [Endomicrobiales bacterium]|nr:hypothetical protein [Endomicrobiales bacterium]
MKYFRGFMGALLILTVYVNFTFASGKRIDTQNNQTENPAKETKELFEIKGKAFFFDFTGTGERVCNAFLVANDDMHFCLLYNKVTKKLQNEAHGKQHIEVSLKGKLHRINDTPYMEVITYEILE